MRIFLLDLVATPRGLLAPLPLGLVVQSDESAVIAHLKELVPEYQPAEAWSHVGGDQRTYVLASLPAS